MKIGILGGIGPEATACLYSKLIGKLQASRKIKGNRDFPQIFINSIPAPELLGESASEEELLPYAEGLKELDCFNPNFILMACNTIHLFRESLQAEVKAPILDLREEVRERLVAEGVKSIAVLGTPMMVKGGLFKFAGVGYVAPSEEELAQLSTAVFNFNKGERKEKQREVAKKIAERCLEQGAEKLVLGCTEIALMLREEGLASLDTMDVLADAACRRALER